MTELTEVQTEELLGGVDPPKDRSGRGIRAFRSPNTTYDQYLIVIAGDAWRITGDDKMVAEHKYVGVFARDLMYEATQIDPKDVPNSVAETAKLIAMECYAPDWYEFSNINADIADPESELTRLRQDKAELVRDMELSLQFVQDDAKTLAVATLRTAITNAKKES